ncbi:hypothetical protein Ahy_A08g040535 [Arachis hypogaea]|uniref:Protein PLASTID TRANSCRIPTIONALLY ACTIVE 7 n=1 Tax=Arachis hypogaea TaxID=3818 RepID=A0A445BZI8_ARAHY|nr:hypothetical protein Ahy_A08g040535 [Arachis hypogaea]
MKKNDSKLVVNPAFLFPCNRKSPSTSSSSSSPVEGLFGPNLIIPLLLAVFALSSWRRRRKGFLFSFSPLKVPLLFDLSLCLSSSSLFELSLVLFVRVPFLRRRHFPSSLASRQRYDFVIKIELRAANSWSPSLTVSSQMMSQMRKDSRGRRIWRRRRLTKKDEYLPFKMERVPFLEEQVRIIKEQGKLLTLDIYKLLLSEDNQFDFVNEIAAEANEYVENNVDEYGGEKKAILHVLSNRMNDMGFPRPDAYAESDPFKPGPDYLKQEFT